MSTYSNITGFFEQKGPGDVERFVEKNLDISEQVLDLLKDKGWSQKDLAKALGKSTAEVSKWLSGTHNLTLRSIAKMEDALGTDIIMTPQKARKAYSRVHFATLRYQAVENRIVREDLNYKPQELGKKVSKLKTMVA